MKEVIYEIGDIQPNTNEVVINRDKYFIPISHEQSDGIAVKWQIYKPDSVKGGIIAYLLDTK